MAPYSTIPKDEAEPLVAAAPKAASPKFKAAALAICLASAVAGYHKQGIQRFTYEEYSPCVGCENLRRLRFKSKSGDYNGCVALYGRNKPYSNGGSPIQMQECILEDNNGGQRQNIQIPGAGRNPRGAKGTLKFYLTSNLCIGGPDGKLTNNVAVYSDQCRTGYKVKMV